LTNNSVVLQDLLYLIRTTELLVNYTVAPQRVLVR
jgi:hypothetical protein